MKLEIIIIFLFCCLTAISQQRKQYELYFDSGKALLNNKGFNYIDSVFNSLDTLKKIRSVYIYGYCDSIGNNDYNNKLSIKRAENVKAYLLSKGIKNDSILIQGYGKTIQKYDYDKWNQNRRVSFDINYLKKQIAQKPKKTPIKIADNSIQETKLIKDTAKSEIEKFVEKSEVGDKIALKNIIFYGGSQEPKPESFKTLEALLKTLKDNATVEISIEGHICCYITDDDDLSGRRAKTVYNYLVENRIDKDRLKYKGFGHTQPLTQERTEGEMEMNRRVEIRILKK